MVPATAARYTKAVFFTGFLNEFILDIYLNFIGREFGKLALLTVKGVQSICKLF